MASKKLQTSLGLHSSMAASLKVVINAAGSSIMHNAVDVNEMHTHSQCDLVPFRLIPFCLNFRL